MRPHREACTRPLTDKDSPPSVTAVCHPRQWRINSVTDGAHVPSAARARRHRRGATHEQRPPRGPTIGVTQKGPTFNIYRSML